MHRQASGGHHNNPAAAGNVGSSPEGNEGESDFVMVPEHLTMDAAEVRYFIQALWFIQGGSIRATDPCQY